MIERDLGSLPLPQARNRRWQNNYFLRLAACSPSHSTFGTLDRYLGAVHVVRVAAGGVDAVAAGAAEVDVAAIESGAAADGDEIAVVAVSSLALEVHRQLEKQRKFRIKIHKRTLFSRLVNTCPGGAGTGAGTGSGMGTGAGAGAAMAATEVARMTRERSCLVFWLESVENIWGGLRIRKECLLHLVEIWGKAGGVS